MQAKRMNEARKKRVALVALLVLGVGSAATLAMMGMKENMNHYFSPTDIAEGKAKSVARVRLGGWVKEGSLRRASDSVLSQFKLTDRFRCVPVKFDRILPDLFREGDTAVATGIMGADGVLVADEVLAKHDENYKPPGVEDYAAIAAKRVAAAGGKVVDCTP
jgi:cytochrome c-type biogenesis protein CcmE